MLTTIKKSLNLQIALILLLFFMGIAIRLYFFPTYSVWWGDQGRDYMVGHKIANKGIHIVNGHWNSGLGVVYPNTYYYYMAIITKLGSGDYFMMYAIQIAIYSVAIVVIFLISRYFLSVPTSFFLSFIYSIHPKFIQFSLTQISANLSILLVLISCLFFVHGFKKNKIYAYILSAFFLALSVSVFFASIMILSLYVAILLSKALKDLSYLKNLVVFISSFLIASFFIFLPVLSSYISLLGRLQISSEIMTQTNVNHIRNATLLFYERFQELHPIFTPLILILYIFSLIQILLKTKNSSTLLFYFLFLIIFFGQFFAYSLLGYTNMPHYLLYSQILLLPVIGLIIDNIRHRKWLYLIAIIFILFSTNFYNKYPEYGENVTYSDAKKIYGEIVKYFPGVLIIYTQWCNNTDDGDWDSRMFWYFQKEKPYFLFTNQHSQIGSTYPNRIYICHVVEDEFYMLQEKNDINKENFEIKHSFKINDRSYFLFKE